MLRIEIETDGTRIGTRILLDGREIPNLNEFSFGVKGGRSSKPKMQMQIWEEGRGLVLQSFFAQDFEKFDSCAVRPDSFIGER